MLPPDLTCPRDAGTLAYWDVGSHDADQTLLLIHGWAGDKVVWLESIERLGATFRCLAVDLPGHGATKDASPVTSPRAQADVVADLADAMKVRRAIVVGHSLGTWTALHLALARPDLVAGLVLCNPPHPTEGVWSGRLVRRSPVMVPTLRLLRRWQLAAGRFAPPTGGGKVGAALRRSRAGGMVSVPVMERTLDGIFEHGLGEEVRELRVPTLVVAGQLDVTAPPTGARAVAAWLPEAELATLARSSHHPMIEQPDEFAALVRAWTQRVFDGATGV